jgi:D-tyrosyl-tRNA(Tyr) deacylase
MRAVIQRVKYASCTIDGIVSGAIEQGFCIFVGFCDQDKESVMDKMIHKIINLRVFEDEKGLMNRSLSQIGGKILLISQFTLYADCKKGNRPSFIKAAKPMIASPMYEKMIEKMRSTGVVVETGKFGADMKIELLNDGPVTIWLDSEEL